MKKAVNNIFPEAIVEVEQYNNGYGRASLHSNRLPILDKFKMILQRDRIRTAARAILLRSIDHNNSILIYFNKQAAYAGHVSFSEQIGESPLGPIKVNIETKQPIELIDWLTGNRSKD